jgi:hypothetical protein
MRAVADTDGDDVIHAGGLGAPQHGLAVRGVAVGVEMRVRVY